MTGWFRELPPIIQIGVIIGTMTGLHDLASRLIDTLGKCQ